MDILDLLEYEQPKLKCNLEKIYHNVSDISEYEFKIKNIGKGILKGSVTSDIEILEFDKIKLEGNKEIIKYKINTAKYASGDTIRGNCRIISNGGDLIIPIEINVISNYLQVDFKTKIERLEDLYIIAQENIEYAKNIFIKDDFLNWLIEINYDYIEIYKNIVNTMDPTEGLETFFIINKLKEEVRINCETKNIALEFKNGAKDAIFGEIVIKKSSFGYINEEIKLRKNTNCITLKQTHINTEDFNINNEAIVKYEVYPKKIKGYSDYDIITVGNRIKIPIKIKEKRQAYINVSKEVFNFNDSGYIEVINNNINPIDVKVSIKDKFIKLSNQNYTITRSEKIYFSIKFNTLQMAQISIKKYPVVYSEIIVTVSTSLTTYTKKIKFVIGAIY